MTKLNENSEKATIIDGVVLTESAIAELSTWQKSNNETAKMHMDSIADAVCFIAQNLSRLDYDKDAVVIMEGLGYARNSISRLMKP